jgi:hypothetical protein
MDEWRDCSLQAPLGGMARLEDDERMLHSALASDAPPPSMPGMLARIIEAIEERDDFGAGAAMLRAAQQRVKVMTRRSA